MRYCWLLQNNYLEPTRQVLEACPHPCWKTGPATCQTIANGGCGGTFQATPHACTNSRRNAFYAQVMFVQEQDQVPQSSCQPLFSDASRTTSFRDILLASTTSRPPYVFESALKTCFAYTSTSDENASRITAQASTHPSNLLGSGSCQHAFAVVKVSAHVSSTNFPAFLTLDTRSIIHLIDFCSGLSSTFFR